MNDKIFIDTNLLIYLISSDEIKSKKIEETLRFPFNFVISTQVINEFVHTCLRKKLLPMVDIEKMVDNFILFFEVKTIEQSTILIAFEMHRKFSFSWYDSLIVAAAYESNYSTLFSEDMQNRLSINEQLTIQNPFFS